MITLFQQREPLEMKRALLIFKIAFIVCFLSTNAMAAEIHKAARKGDLEDVRALIAAGADLSELDKAVGTALHWAAARGHVEVARALIEAGADPSQESHGPDLLTPLHLASTGGHVLVVQLLVEAGADLAAGEGNIGTPLHSAAQADKAKVIDYLLSAGADPEAKATDSIYAVLPLQFAAAAGASNAISALLSGGASINAENGSSGVTALHLAVFNAHPEAAMVLLEAGADPYAVSTNIETPAALAKYNPDMEALFASAGIE